MKKIRTHLYILFAASAFFIFPASLFAGSDKGGKTVIDYYLLIPDKYFQCETENIMSQKDKLSLIKKKNLKKGYIQSSTKEGNSMEIAVFTDDYLGLTVLALNVRCSTGCMCRNLAFFFVSNSKLMKEEDGAIFPKTVDIEKAAGVNGGYEFILTEDGKNIKVAEEGSGKVLLLIEWSGGTFNIK